MSLTKFKDTVVYVSGLREDLNALEAAPPAREAVKICTPFYISVMVYNPEAGWKFLLKVQKSCNMTNDPIWKLRFNLDRLIKDEFVRVLEVEAGLGTDGEVAGAEKIVKDGINEGQLDLLVDEIYPKTKILAEEQRDPTMEEAKDIRSSMKKLVSAE